MGSIPTWARDIDGKLSAIQEYIGQFDNQSKQNQVDARQIALQDIKFDLKNIIKYSTRTPLDQDDLTHMANLYKTLDEQCAILINELVEKYGQKKETLHTDLKEAKTFYTLVDENVFDWGELLPNYLEIQNFIVNKKPPESSSRKLFDSDKNRYHKGRLISKKAEDFMRAFIEKSKGDDERKCHTCLWRFMERDGLLVPAKSKKHHIDWLKENNFITEESYIHVFMSDEKNPLDSKEPIASRKERYDTLYDLYFPD